MVFCFIGAIILPLISSISIGVFHKHLNKERTNIIACYSVLASCILTLSGTFFSIRNAEPGTLIEFASFINFGDIRINWSFYFDTLTKIFMSFITLISTLVHFYSTGYMEKDAGIKRFMGYLNLFTFSMLLLVTSGSFFQMFIGWEGVGLTSYLLVGFWFERASARTAAIKAFIINRIADAGILFAIFACIYKMNLVNISDLSLPIDLNSAVNIPFIGESFWVTLIGAAFLLGAMGKSAQLGLHTWLPDAMEGPTPVSALIHAATMVTAGVFLMLRTTPFVASSVNLAMAVTLIGSFTALFAGIVGSFQFDIKKSIAYSTCSQLGYMIAAIGALAPHAALFHLTTHACFKALLFLSAGSVIHACSDLQDMRKMGGLYKYIPKTFFCFLIGGFSLCGIPPFSGYFSKESILQALYFTPDFYQAYAFWPCLIAAVLTTFYTSRIAFMTFMGPERLDSVVKDHVHSSGKKMILPMLILSGIVLASGSLVLFFKGKFGMSLLSDVFHIPLFNHELPISLTVLTFSAIGLTMLVEFFLYATKFVEKEGLEKYIPAYFKFWRNKAYIDELYNFVFVKSYLLSSKVFSFFDNKVIDKAIVRFANIPFTLGEYLQKVYTSNLLIMIITLFTSWLLILIYALAKGIIE